MKYKIAVKMITGQIFTYIVKDYEIQDGVISFHNRKANTILKYDMRNCQIEEIL